MTLKINPRANPWLTLESTSEQKQTSHHAETPTATGRAYCLGWLNRAAPVQDWCTILISFIMLLKVWGWRPWRFRGGLLFQAPWKINQSFIKVRSPRELCNQIEKCSRLVSCYCSIKLSYCWGRWLKYRLPHKTWVLYAGNWKIRLMGQRKTFLLNDSFLFFLLITFRMRNMFCCSGLNAFLMHFILHPSWIHVSSKLLAVISLHEAVREYLSDI